MDNQTREMARAFKVLSSGTRLRIVRLLAGRALCVNALAARLGLTAGAVSQHLRVMRDAGLVVDEKRGYYVHYRLDGKRLADWREKIGVLLGPDDSDGPAQTGGGRSCAARTVRKRNA